MNDELLGGFLGWLIFFFGVWGGAVAHRAGVVNECEALGVSFVGDYRLTCEKVQP